MNMMWIITGAVGAVVALAVTYHLAQGLRHRDGARGARHAVEMLAVTAIGVPLAAAVPCVYALASPWATTVATVVLAVWMVVVIAWRDARLEAIREQAAAAGRA